MAWAHWGDSAGARFEFGPELPPDMWEAPERVLELVDCGTWGAGEATDDTDQAKMIFDSHLAFPNDMYKRVAYFQSAIHEWAGAGPKDIGGLTSSAVRLMTMGDLSSGGKSAWLRSYKRPAGNGGIMRCHPTAVMLDGLTDVINETIAMCQVTHYDPRCVASCLFQNCLVHSLLGGAKPEEAVWDSVTALIKTKSALVCDGADAAAVESAISEVIWSVNLGMEAVRDGQKIPSTGYTIHGACHAAAAALSVTMKSPQASLAYSICHGDDADTNGSIAGAVIGAAVGDYSVVPMDGLEYARLFEKEILKWN